MIRLVEAKQLFQTRNKCRFLFSFVFLIAPPKCLAVNIVQKKQHNKMLHCFLISKIIEQLLSYNFLVPLS